MTNLEIDNLISKYKWITVSPVGFIKGSDSPTETTWNWTCAVFKRFKKSGNWSTENCKTFKSPQEAYKWGLNEIKQR